MALIRDTSLGLVVATTTNTLDGMFYCFCFHCSDRFIVISVLVNILRFVTSVLVKFPDRVIVISVLVKFTDRFVVIVLIFTDDRNKLKKEYKK